MSKFYEQAWDLVLRIPSGRVMNYGHVALVLGSPGAAQSVGNAMAMLPIDSDIPWWRVVRVNGSIALKGRGAGADRQRELLEAEGVKFGAAGRVNMRVYSWEPDE